MRPVVPGIGRPAPPATVCNAPFSAAYLDPRGFVRACCMNNDHLLGDLRTERLADIWHGAATRSLRRALEGGDLSLGCQQCSWAEGGAGSANAYARIFDRFPHDEADPAYPRTLHLALGNHCNLRCGMCNGGLSSSIRRDQGFAPLPNPYGDQFFEDLDAFLPHLEELQFLGGEPFLVPAHHRVWDRLRALGLSTKSHVTTNGTIWNDKVEQILADFPVSVTVSLDGVTAETFESIRVGAKLDRVIENADRFKAYCNEQWTSITFAFSLMTVNWHEFGSFLRFAEDRDVDVFVNRVVHPRRFSLAWCTDAERADIIARMEQADGDVADLPRNGAVWRAELDHLRRIAGRAASRPGSDFGGTLAEAVPMGVPPEPGSGGFDPAEELRSWGTGDPVTLLVDDHDLIVEIEPPDARVAGLDLRPLVGRGLDELMGLFYAAFGHHAAVERHTEGVLDRRSLYRFTEPSVELRLLAVAVAGGMTRSHLAWRSPAEARADASDGAVAVAAPRSRNADRN